MYVLRTVALRTCPNLSGISYHAYASPTLATNSTYFFGSLNLCANGSLDLCATDLWILRRGSGCYVIRILFQMNLTYIDVNLTVSRKHPDLPQQPATRKLWFLSQHLQLLISRRSTDRTTKLIDNDDDDGCRPYSGATMDVVVVVLAIIVFFPSTVEEPL